ncbi:MAG TPA: bifunctional DNA-formamidopyrimidine glycosylase/DNA-(apurinic or apyrimidinic site) lyase [Phycisphaerales bacterium]|nr:bifunctional DNA-formamidopyrimidine glycosylase/DNA-(apurinic or apyrimidinic site) lyase [Phycisphaerales bacterium]
MPELPEVERVRRTLEPHLVGRRLARGVLHRADICHSYQRTAKGITEKDTTPSDLLAGDTVHSLLRHGKQLAIIGESRRCITVHLGMSGQLLWRPKGTELPATHVHAQWLVEARKGQPTGTLVFRDPRRFGGLWTFDSLASLREARWSKLGPDALEVTANHLIEALNRSKRPIKAALLDQEVIAGVGNIYADEALFLAGIKPQRLARRVKPEEHRRLVPALRTVLERSIASGGSTLRDYVDAEGRKGTAQQTHAVYGRGGEPCPQCGRTLRQGVVGGRTTVWCSRCQK